MLEISEAINYLLAYAPTLPLVDFYDAEKRCLIKVTLKSPFIDALECLDDNLLRFQRLKYWRHLKQ